MAFRPSRFVLGLACLVLLGLFRYGWAVGISFINDDFLFLERARTATFAENWNADDAIGNVYRPLTRNVYFWLGLRLGGRDPGPYHVVNLVVLAAGLVLMALTARRLLTAAFGLDEARASSAGLLAALLFTLHPAAGTPAAWVCGVQDLLAVDLALAAILAHLAGRRALSVLAFTAALLSKETAAFLFILLALWDWVVERAPLRRALLRQAPAAAIFAAWLVLNPWLPWNELGRTVHSRVPGEASLLGRFDLETIFVTLRSLALIEPAVAFSWPHDPLATAGQALAVAALLAIAFKLLLGSGVSPARRVQPGKPIEPAARRQPGARGVLGFFLFAILWSLSAILPLVTVISHFAYYAYYPALGLALLAVGLTIVVGMRPAGRVPAAALAAAVAAALAAGDGRVHPAGLWDAHNIRRASAHLWNFRADLLKLHPALPESTRAYFWNIPYWIGFQLADGPALRVWYGNPSLSGHFLSTYTPDQQRPTLFFGHDDAMHLVEIVRGRPDPQLTTPPPIYAAAHTDLGSTLAGAGETEAAIIEWQKVLEVDPDFAAAAANLGMTLSRLGRAAEAAEVLAQAVVLEPEAADVRLDLGRAYLELGRYAEALTALEAYLALAPDAPERARIEHVIGELRAELSRSP